ncbi:MULTISPECIES: hypothetical protein [unclassified Chelatococcus]|uniref:hypothetical protein n=1 Tax=unclassified Chelatococcus TaxID=2638111 RepID=UPI001BCE336F|nr:MULTISPECIES: hypothetical protein [unclassified Chelatococcus]MBS7699119.1 hypothetical protein [Chelatococcus sp. YT9]MBX3554900.1 hypothetical protein [Chelatococcus sp.]
MKLLTMPEIIGRIPGARGVGKRIARATGVLPPKHASGREPLSIQGPSTTLPTSSEPIAPPRPKRQLQKAIDAGGLTTGELQIPEERRQGLIYIPIRAQKLRELAQIWNEQRFIGKKGLYGILQKPDDMLESTWLATRPLRDLDCEAKLYVLLDADIPGHSDENVIGGVEDPVTYSGAKAMGTPEPRPNPLLSAPQKLVNNAFLSRERTWSPDTFAKHMKASGLPTDFRFLRLYIGFSQYVKSKHGGAPYGSHPGCAFAKQFAAAMNKLGYKHLEIRGYFGVLAMADDDVMRNHRYTKIYFENPRPTPEPDYFKPSQKSFVYYSNTDDVRSQTIIGRTSERAEHAAEFIKHPLNTARDAAQKWLFKKIIPRS